MSFLDMALETLGQMGKKCPHDGILPSAREEKLAAAKPSGQGIGGETDCTVVEGNRLSVRAEPKAQSVVLEGSSPSLAKYLAALNAWQPENAMDLPFPPPFPDRPERPIAWGAWWDAVHKSRARRERRENG